MNFKVKLTRVSSRHNNLRTATVEGVTNFLPELHHSVLIFAEPLTPEASVRVVRTTQITELEKTSETSWNFKTLNSSYTLELLDGEDK